jgi:hypothetical protein
MTQGGPASAQGGRKQHRLFPKDILIGAISVPIWVAVLYWQGTPFDFAIIGGVTALLVLVAVSIVRRRQGPTRLK